MTKQDAVKYIKQVKHMAETLELPSGDVYSMYTQPISQAAYLGGQAEIAGKLGLAKQYDEIMDMLCDAQNEVI